MTTPDYYDPRRARGIRARFAAAALRLAGWRVVLAEPVPAKCVVVFYPHTSNWDFPWGLFAKWLVGIHFRWVAKHTLFAGPAGALFRRWGGIPIDRRAPSGFIETMRRAFDEAEAFHLVITPEGTRSRVERWKSGFWHLARAAKVPVALGFIDYARREVGVGGYVELSDDPAADMARLAAFYADKRAYDPARAGRVTM